MPISEDFASPSGSSNPPSKVLQNIREQTYDRSASPNSSDSNNTDGSDGDIRQHPRITRFASSVRSEDGGSAASRSYHVNFEDDAVTPATTGTSGSRHTSGSYGSSPTTGSYSASSGAYVGYGQTQIPYPGRSREGSASSQLGAIDTSAVPAPTNGFTAAPRMQRPGVARTPSNAYAPARRPSQFPQARSQLERHRTGSFQQRKGRNPDADYQAEKKAYIQRLKQDNADEDNRLVEEGYSPNMGYNSDTDGTDGESPATTVDYGNNDPYEQEAMLYNIGNEDMSPSEEELKIPANRERLEWHSMLANVLTGDVVKQEKKRMTSLNEQATDAAIRYDLWVGVRAKTCGRPVAIHKKLLDEQRAKAPPMVEEIVSFEIRGEAEVGRTPAEQVEDIVKKIDRLGTMYPNTTALEAAQPRAKTDEFKATVAAVTSWQNIMAAIDTELGILQNWVGNDRMDFTAPREKKDSESHLTDDSSFLDRILKEDGLKSIGSERSLLVGVNEVIQRAKANMIANADSYANKHLPSYIEELMTLIAFPSRVVQEIIRIRLQYAERIKDTTQQGVLMADTMIPQFRILLKLAVKVKDEYLKVAQPEPNWDLPPCIDENFDQVVLNAIQFYFKMLSWQMAAGKNALKEAEILEQEWGFLSTQALSFDGGDVEVAESFR